jgi:ferredoxin-type protein NapG
MSDNTPIDRRRFFRQGLRELLKPLVNAAEPIERVLSELESFHAPPPPAATARRFHLHPPLRPPGALDEERFRETCSRSGECVAACPAQAIRIDPTADRGGGAPYIDAVEMPCVVCDGLYCMEVCPSGALVKTPRLEIDMGTASWHEGLCLRSHAQDCTICVDQCPLGSAAIVIDAQGKVDVIEEGCIGCGVCEHACPTSPKSIEIIPRVSLR